MVQVVAFTARPRFLLAAQVLVTEQLQVFNSWEDLLVKLQGGFEWFDMSMYEFKQDTAF